MPAATPPESSRRPLLVGLALFVGLLVLASSSVRVGHDGFSSLTDAWQAALAWVGLTDPLPGTQQAIAELRWSRVLVSIAVGAGLASSGALLQGVFRNDLASPSILGLSSGAGLGASVAILAIGGFGPLSSASIPGAWTTWWVTGCAFLGAASVTLLVTLLSTRDGRISVPQLLLVGIALNAVAGGLHTAIQSFALQDFEATRAMMAWSFGSLADQRASNVILLWGAVGGALVTSPFVARELDLFAGGEDDAAALGVDTRRVKLLALGAATLASAAAVAVAGQIAFLGLVVPHLLRLAVGRSHRALLPLCALGGPVLLLGGDLVQRVYLRNSMPPGVLMSLFGGPFFLYLLLRRRGALRTW